MKQSSKKKATKGTPRRQTVKQRAQAIIADLEGYDADTRDAIKFALEHNDSDLPELVRRAEAGDTICDLIHVAKLHRQAALWRVVPRTTSSPTP